MRTGDKELVLLANSAAKQVRLFAKAHEPSVKSYNENLARCIVAIYRDRYYGCMVPLKACIDEYVV